MYQSGGGKTKEERRIRTLCKNRARAILYKRTRLPLSKLPRELFEMQFKLELAMVQI